MNQAPDAEEEVWTSQEVAAFLKVHLKTVHTLAQEGKIPAVRIGRSWRFSKSEIHKLFKPGVPTPPAVDDEFWKVGKRGET